MSKYKVTPAMLKSGISDNECHLISNDDNYIFSNSTTWPFKWVADLHARYFLWRGYNCVNVKVETLKGNGE